MTVAAITALLFGLHPMHVESVAWVAGRKDLIYSFFYLGCCITYLCYMRSKGIGKWLSYSGVVVLFICSLLAKPVAVILPVTLLLLDLFENRMFNVGNKKINTSVIWDKLLLFGLSIVIGLGGYALTTYLWKALVPVKLLCFYPYPFKERGHLPPRYYLCAILIIGLLFMVWRYWRHKKAVVFGTFFFLTNIVLLLQFIPVGGALIAERYAYLPYLGLFFILGWEVSSLFEKGRYRTGRLFCSAIAVYAFALGFVSKERCKVWYDGMSLWRDEIRVEPVKAIIAYNNLGCGYADKFTTETNSQRKQLYYDSSFYLLNKAIMLRPAYVNTYVSLGELLRRNNQFADAKKYYYEALSFNKKEHSAYAYFGLALIYSTSFSAEPQLTTKVAWLDSARFCYDQALKCKPDFALARTRYAEFLKTTDGSVTP